MARAGSSRAAFAGVAILVATLGAPCPAHAANAPGGERQSIAAA